MTPPPAVAVAAPPIAEPANPVERAVADILSALERTQGDRVVLESNQIPVLQVGSRRCALTPDRLSARTVEHIARYLFPVKYLEALDEIGGTCYRWPGFTALATDDGAALTIEIKRSKH